MIKLATISDAKVKLQRGRCGVYLKNLFRHHILDVHRFFRQVAWIFVMFLCFFDPRTQCNSVFFFFSSSGIGIDWLLLQKEYLKIFLLGFMRVYSSLFANWKRLSTILVPVLTTRRRRTTKALSQNFGIGYRSSTY